MSDDEREIRLEKAFATLDRLSVNLVRRTTSLDEAYALLAELHRKYFRKREGESNDGEQPEQEE
ncbi:MAG: hypothetical protein LC785_17005 [Acidobacteria bacterium]|nr:hypothetical protein [Acidobacteriota bacterium]MCA1643597.1 hypothetical protein [Acidobacteriota bacterium]